MEQNDMLVIGVAVVLLLISFVVWRLNHVAATYVLQDPSGGTKSKTTVIVNVKKPDGTEALRIQGKSTDLEHTGWRTWNDGTKVTLVLDLMTGNLNGTDGTRPFTLVRQ